MPSTAKRSPSPSVQKKLKVWMGPLWIRVFPRSYLHRSPLSGSRCDATPLRPSAHPCLQHAHHDRTPRHRARPSMHSFASPTLPFASGVSSGHSRACSRALSASLLSVIALLALCPRLAQTQSSCSPPSRRCAPILPASRCRRSTTPRRCRVRAHLAFLTL